VQVDDARGQRETARVDALARGAQVLADGGDTAVDHGDTTRARRASQPIDHGRVIDHQIVHERSRRGQPR
jgi:hypothetical protein